MRHGHSDFIIQMGGRPVLILPIDIMIIIPIVNINYLYTVSARLLQKNCKGFRQHTITNVSHPAISMLFPSFFKESRKKRCFAIAAKEIFSY